MFTWVELYSREAQCNLIFFLTIVLRIFSDLCLYFRPPMMEGDSPELEIDSELVMSFYDQYQVLCQPEQTLFTDKSFRLMI